MGNGPAGFLYAPGMPNGREPGPGAPAYPRARLTADHAPPPGEEIRVYPGDPLRIGEESPEYPGWLRCTTAAGRSCWIPEAYVRWRGSRGTVLTEYDSRELSARAGDVVALLREIAGWVWVRTPDGREASSREAGGSTAPPELNDVARGPASGARG